MRNRRIYDGWQFRAVTHCRVFSFQKLRHPKKSRVSYIRPDFQYLVMWDKPGSNSAPGRFYDKIRENFGDDVRFIQRSVYGVKTLESAEGLVELAEHYGLEVLVFRVVEVPDVS